MSEPALYDVTRALGELNQARARADQDPLIAETINVADGLVRNMARHFSDAQSRHTAGCALIIAGASLAALRDLPVDVVCNVAALAGQQLYQGGAG